YAHERIGEINSIRIFGQARQKGAIVSFEMKGAHPHDVATIIDRAGVAVRAGTHCVMPLLARFGITATCRASFALYNTREEVDIPAQALRKAQEFLSCPTTPPTTCPSRTPRLRRRRPAPRCRRTRSRASPTRS